MPRLQAEALQRTLTDLPVRLGMQIGNPPLAESVHQLIEAGVERLIVLPMYPQYSAATTASAMDCLFAALKQEGAGPPFGWGPPLMTIRPILTPVAPSFRKELAS